MTTSDDELLALARGATPGPWHSAGGYLTVRDPTNSSFDLTIYHIDEMGQHTRKAPFQAIPFACSEDAAYIAAANPSAIIALIERYRAEVDGKDALLNDYINANARRTRERDEARELAGEAKCKNCDTPIAKCQQSRRDGFLTCCPECDHASAESALHAAQKRIAELEGALRWYAEDWRYEYDNDCCFCGVDPERRRRSGGIIRKPDTSENGVLADEGERARAALAGGTASR